MKGQTNAWLKNIVSGEKISITLMTNQSSHTDLMGAVITVSYAGNLTEYTWEGSAIQTVIPPMADYTVSYSNVNGYSTPEPFTGRAVDGSVSEVIGTYNTEVVTVNISAEEGEVSGYEVTIVKVNKYGSNNEYTKVEYIESNAKQYINTGFIPDSNTRVVMDAEVPDSSSAVYVFGVSDWTSGARFQIRATSSSTTYTSDYGSSGINTQVTAAGRLIFDKNKNVCTIGEVVTEHAVETFTCASSLKLLAGVTTSGSHAASPTGKIYSCQIYDNDVLVRDYVPVIDSDGVAGLWDKVNEMFCSSSTSNEFVAGDIDGDVIATQTIPSASYKIPYGISYVVKSNFVAGFTEPSKQLFTALQSSRVVDVIYAGVPYGVYIQGVSGRLYTKDEWNSQETANGVAIATEQCKFVISLNSRTDTYWGEDALLDGIVTTKSSSTAIKDYNGEHNTAIIRNSGIQSGMIDFVDNAVFPNGKVGYVGSAGEWNIFQNNMTLANELLTLAGGLMLPSHYRYYTSTQYDIDEAWTAGVEWGWASHQKTYSLNVVPFLSFK